MVKRFGRFRRVIRWVPPALLATVLAAAWGVLFSGGMAGVVAWILLASVIGLLGIASLLSVGVFAVWKRRMSGPIASTLFLSLIAVWPFGWDFGVGRIRYPGSLETASPAATIRLPSNEPLLVGWGGDRLETNYHSYAPDQRWAYDLLVEPAFHGSSNLEDYGCWGTPVLAPVSGTVHATHDGDPDIEPGSLSTGVTNPTGNSVTLKLETDTFLIISHLKRGSVAVEPGDVVA